MTLSSFGLLWLTLICVSAGQILLKLGVGTEKIPVGGSIFQTLGNILGAMLRPKAVIGFGFYVVGTFIWLLILSRVPLSIAFPMFSMSYFLVVILSATVLNERVDWRFAIIGLILISLGVTCIGLSSPKAGNSEQKGEVGSGRLEVGGEASVSPFDRVIHDPVGPELVGKAVGRDA